MSTFTDDERCLECQQWIEDHYYCAYRRRFDCAPCPHQTKGCDK